MQIQLKRDATKTISQFFSKKGANSQQEPNSESMTVKEEPKSLKEEFETEDEVNYQPVIKSNEDDIKPDLCDISSERVLKVPVKREFEGSSTDTTHADDDSEKQHESPVKKKGRGASDDTMVNLKEQTKKSSPVQPHKTGGSSARKKAPNASDKQPTLFSYFGKG